MTGKEEPNIDWSLTTWKGSRLQQHLLAWRKSRGLPYIDLYTGELVKGNAPQT